MAKTCYNPPNQRGSTFKSKKSMNKLKQEKEARRNLHK